MYFMERAEYVGMYFMERVEYVFMELVSVECRACIHGGTCTCRACIHGGTCTCRACIHGGTCTCRACIHGTCRGCIQTDRVEDDLSFPIWVKRSRLKATCFIPPCDARTSTKAVSQGLVEQKHAIWRRDQHKGCVARPGSSSPTLMNEFVHHFETGRRRGLSKELEVDRSEQVAIADAFKQESP